MAGELPNPIHRQDEYMHAMCRRLDAQNELLAEIRDRLPVPVELTVGGGPAGIVIREPLASTVAADGGNPASAPPPRAKRAPAKKAAPRAVTEGT